jgi:hypothetical protein
MDSLAEIMARVERLAFAGEAEQEATPDVVLAASPSSEELSLLSLAVPQAEMLLPPEYIQAEAFLEVSGYFTPSSNRIKHIYTKEKKIREYVDAQGTKRTVKTKISANHELGLPITSDLNYYTYCIPSHDSASVLSYQELLTSIQCGEAIARRRKEDRRASSAPRGLGRRWDRFSSRVRHRLVPDRERVPDRCGRVPCPVKIFMQPCDDSS